VKATCCGYREFQNLIFRDETHSILRRVVFPTLPQASCLVPCSIPCGLQSPEDDVAIAYFYAHFVVSDENFSPIQLDFVPHLIHTGTDTLALASMISVGTAVLANISKSPSIASAARRKYVHALSLTRAALNMSLLHNQKQSLCLCYYWQCSRSARCAVLYNVLRANEFMNRQFLPPAAYLS
jgi:hypothetical protein